MDLAATAREDCNVSRSARTVFYSWQSDLPNSVNRGMIGDSLDRAVKAIVADDSIVVDLVVDRDTQSVPGAPDIAATIFEKIEHAAIFVADVSIVHRGDGRAFPNPNVLIELGYALRALGDAHVIIVMNTAFGRPEELPFDLRRKRVLQYHLPDSTNDKPSQRNQLAKSLEVGIRQILPRLDVVPAAPDLFHEATAAIRAQRADEEPAVHDAMKLLSEQIEGLQQLPQRPGFFDDFLVEALPKTIPFVLAFTRLVDAAARSDSQAAMRAIAVGLDDVLDGYFKPTRRGLSIPDQERGLSEFVGHEMIVIVASLMIRHRRWKRLEEFLCVKHLVDTGQGRAHFGFQFFCGSASALRVRQRRLGLPPSLTAQILHERHQNSELAELVPEAEFVQADMFLFMAAELAPETSPTKAHSPRWIPWSYALQANFSHPRLLDEMKSRSVAEAVSAAIGLSSVEQLRTRYAERFAVGLSEAGAHDSQTRFLSEARVLASVP